MTAPRHPGHDELGTAANTLFTTMALEEAEQTALQQARIVTAVLDLMTEVATSASQRPVHSLYEEGRRDGEVDLIRRLHATITRERAR